MRRRGFLLAATSCFALVTAFLITALAGARPQDGGPVPIQAALHYDGGLLSNGELSITSLTVVPVGQLGIPQGAWVNVLCIYGCGAVSNWTATGSRIPHGLASFSGIHIPPGAVIRLKISDPGWIGVFKTYRAVRHPSAHHAFDVVSNCLWPWDSQTPYGCAAVNHALANRIPPGNYCSPKASRRLCINVSSPFAFNELAQAKIDTGMMRCSTGNQLDLTWNGLSGPVDTSRHIALHASTTDSSGREPSDWSVNGGFGQEGTASGTLSVVVHVPHGICRTGLVHWRASLPAAGSTITTTETKTSRTTTSQVPPPPPTPPGPNSSPTAGKYCGHTAASVGGAPEIKICFTVLASRDVRNISVDVRMNCKGGANVLSLSDDEPGLALDPDGSFSYAFSGSPTASFTATFTTDNKVSGSATSSGDGCSTGELPWAGSLIR